MRCGTLAAKMRSQAVILALLLGVPSPGLAEPALRAGFSWDSGPGRHNPEQPAEHGRSQRGDEASRSIAAARGLELRRTIQDGRDRIRARWELRRIDRRRQQRSLRELRSSELELAAWLQRQQRQLDSADRRLDLDAAQLALGPRDRAALSLEREIERARQRVDLERAARRVKLGPSRVGPRF